MQWTEAKPSKPGFYWKRGSDGTEEIVSVREHCGRLAYYPFEYLCDVSLDRDAVAWCGPLEPPAST